MAIRLNHRLPANDCYVGIGKALLPATLLLTIDSAVNKILFGNAKTYSKKGIGTEVVIVLYSIRILGWPS